MALQIRLGLPDFDTGAGVFTDSVILENADEITYTKTINSSDQSLTFRLPSNDSKDAYVNYLRWWEIWDTEQNIRLNYGPLVSIQRESGQNTEVTGTGRPSILNDFFQTIQTFYEYQDQFIDDLRFENLAGQPRTKVIIDKATDSEYYGLSKRTKEFAIDEQTGFIAPGRDTPDRGTIKTKNYWTGIGKADHLIVDLGEEATLSRVKLLLPWWAGALNNINRTYDYTMQVSSDNSSYTTWYSSPVPNKGLTKVESPNGGGKFFTFGDTLPRGSTLTSATPITGRYWKINITDIHGWYGSQNQNANYPTDEYDWECLGTDTFRGSSKPSPTNGDIPKNKISPVSDCHASVVEIALYRRILERDFITQCSYKQIENDNLQIKYTHSPTSDEMITTNTSTVRKFEPGSTFRKVSITGSGTMTVKDEYNTTLYTGGSTTLKLPAFTSLLRISGSSNSQVTDVDAWQSKIDPFSYGGNYSYTTVSGDTAVLRFRGSSLKWLSTVPSGKTSATVNIELISKDSGGNWSSWSTLDGSFNLPTDIHGQKVWEITYESGILDENTVYELRLTNLNGGYLSIDSFAGYWQSSYTSYNEDDPRFYFRHPEVGVQEYDEKYFRGSIYKYNPLGSSRNLHEAQTMDFNGDRILLLSKRGPGLGTMQVEMYHAGVPYGTGNIPIPGGNSDGTLSIDLNHSFEVPQAVVFDSDDYFTSPALPFQSNRLIIRYTPNDPDPIYIDGVIVHEMTKLSVKFLYTPHLEILRNTCQLLGLEWDVTDNGLLVKPRLGEDTYVIFKEGANTTISIQNVEDIEKVATMLVSNGGDIDGIPLTIMAENKKNRAIIGRTITREFNQRGSTDYFALIGASQSELRRRRYPEKRITVHHSGSLDVNEGDSCIIKTPTLETRVRVNTISRTQSRSGGLSYTLECTEWPLID
jgi:hypothetical protein